MPTTESAPQTGADPANATRRAGIVSVASRLFRERGYHAVGMRAIAEAASMQAASLYHHFRNKEEILLEAIFVVDRDLIFDQLPLLGRPGSCRERLVRVLRGHVLHIGHNRDAWWVASRELRALSPEKLESVQHYRRQYQNAIAELIAEGVRAGEFACEDPMLVTAAILDMINGLNVWYTPNGRYTIDELADRYSALAAQLVTA
jgi:AcrR family transcriptional regulator